MRLMHLRTWLAIDTDALHHNLAQVVYMARTAACGVVLKSNAYGHGAALLASVLERNAHVAWFLVGTIAEALQLRDCGSTKHILVMTSDWYGIVDAVMRRITITISDRSSVTQIVLAARQLQQRAQVHIKIDVGLHRLGVAPEEFAAFFTDILAIPEIQVTGVFAHLSDTDDDSYTCACIATFVRVTQMVPSSCVRHIAASGALWVDVLFDMVRVGTVLYGSWKSETHRMRLQDQYPGLYLRPIASWYTSIIQINQVPAGEHVGYGRTYKTKRPMRIAVVPVGYADGFARSFSNCGIVMICGHYAPVIGVVSMNLIMIDVTMIPEAVPGSIVVLMGDCDGIRPNDLSARVHTNPNEITARIADAIPRFLLDVNTA